MQTRSRPEGQRPQLQRLAYVSQASAVPRAAPYPRDLEAQARQGLTQFARWADDSAQKSGFVTRR